jgi:hypothetical protein
MANKPAVKRSRQRYGMLLLALGVTFFFEGVAKPGDAQRAIATILVGAALMLACTLPKSRPASCASQPRSSSRSWLAC